MITGINELETLTKHISCEGKYKFDGTKSNSNQWWNDNKVDVTVKNIIYVKKIIFWILLYEIVEIVNI